MDSTFPPSPSRRLILGGAALLGATKAIASPLTRGDAGQGRPFRPEPPAPQLREGHVESGSARLWWWDTGGSGDPIVLLHPATGSGRTWRYQQGPFVDAGFRVVGYSRRGAAGSEFGQSGDVKTPSDDLRAVLDHLRVERCHLVGSAAGAFVAIDFAHASAQRLHSLVLANSLLNVSGAEVDTMLGDLELSALSALSPHLRELGPTYRAAYPQGVARWKEHLAGSVLATGAKPEPLKSRLTLQDLRNVATPTLLLAGDADLLAPPPLMAIFSRFLPNSRLVRVPASGHASHWEAPDAFNEAVLAFVKQRSAEVIMPLSKPNTTLARSS